MRIHIFFSEWWLWRWGWRCVDDSETVERACNKTKCDARRMQFWREGWSDSTAAVVRQGMEREGGGPSSHRYARPDRRAICILAPRHQLRSFVQGNRHTSI